MTSILHIDIQKTLHTQNGPRNIEYTLDLQEGELLGVFGPSGAGKSSLLRMVSGLMIPDQGVIRYHGNVWFDSTQGICLPAEHRHTGMVFQEHNLFPNMDVESNLKFALRKGGTHAMIESMLELLQLTELRHRKPLQLSGGQCQRVALARALIHQPSLLLLDEPFSSLDWSLRWRLQEELLDWHRRFSCTSLFVSHDLLELSRLADRLHALGDVDLNPNDLEAAASIYADLGRNLRKEKEKSYA